MSLNDELVRLHDAIGRNKIIPTPDITPVFTGSGVELRIVALPASGGSNAKTEIAAGSISGGSGLIYDVALINPLTGEELEITSVKAMPLQLNYFYTIPAGTKVVVIPLDVNTTGDGSGV